MAALRVFSDCPVSSKERTTWLLPADWASISVSNAELLVLLSQKPFWLAFLGYTLDGDIAGSRNDVLRFSMLSLAVKLANASKPTGRPFSALLCNYQDAYTSGHALVKSASEAAAAAASAAAKAGNGASPPAGPADCPSFFTPPWSLSKVAEARTETSALVPLSVCLSDTASRGFWLGRLARMLRAATFPTAAQADEAALATRVLVLSKGLALEGLVPGLSETMEGAPPSNAAVAACVAAAAAGLAAAARAANAAGAAAASAGPGPRLNLEWLLPTLQAALFFAAVTNGVGVDDLKAAKWAGVRAWPSPPVLVRRTTCEALARLSPLALLGGLNSKPGLWKVLDRPSSQACEQPRVFWGWVKHTHTHTHLRRFVPGAPSHT